jgi:hypothetical protein
VQPRRGAVRLWSSEAEDEHQGFVDGEKLVRVEASGGSAESPRIDDGGLLDEDAYRGAVERDRWSNTKTSKMS